MVRKTSKSFLLDMLFYFYGIICYIRFCAVMLEKKISMSLFIFFVILLPLKVTLICQRYT